MRQLTRVVMIILFIISSSGCSNKGNQRAQGYIEGRYTYITTNVSGVLDKLLVARGTRVTQGQLLIELQQQPEIDAYHTAKQILQESIAARAAIAANLTYAKLTLGRYKILVPKNAIQQSQLDSAKATYDATAAQLNQANATIAANTASLAQAEWTKNQKTLYAPVNAIVFDTYYRLGEYTQANQAIISLLAPQDIKVIFYIPEKNLSRIKLGAQVTVSCDNCKKSYPATISFISPTQEYTPPVIYSEDTNEKLIYRIEAEFKPDDAYQMHPGQPVYVTYQNNG